MRIAAASSRARRRAATLPRSFQRRVITCSRTAACRRSHSSRCRSVKPPVEPYSSSASARHPADERPTELFSPSRTASCWRALSSAWSAASAASIRRRRAAPYASDDAASDHRASYRASSSNQRSRNGSVADGSGSR